MGQNVIAKLRITQHTLCLGITNHTRNRRVTEEG